MNGHPPSLDAPTLSRLSETILELNDLTLPADGLFDRVAAHCESIIPSSNLWVACSDTVERTITCYFGPWAGQAIDLAPAFGRNIASHPQFIALCEGTARPVDAVSDYISLRKWRATAMFNEVVRHAGAVDQLSSSLPLGGNLSFSIIINRDRWKFTPEERLILRLLTPHAIQAWRTRQLLEKIPSGEAALDDTRSDFSCKLIADHLGNIVEAPEAVIGWLIKAFSEPDRALSKALPEIIRVWMKRALAPLRHHRIGAALAVDFTTRLTTAQGVPLQLTLAPGSRYDLHVLAFTALPSGPESETLKLTRLGLSLRQAEILYWVSCGKTNEEVAGVLGISLFTVKAHLRAIFPILMVENRNAAATVAWHLLQQK